MLKAQARVILHDGKSSLEKVSNNAKFIRQSNEGVTRVIALFIMFLVGCSLGENTSKRLVAGVAT
jgi:hypothetical protein